MLRQWRPVETSGPQQPLTFALASPSLWTGAAAENRGQMCRGASGNKGLSGLQIGLPGCQNKNSSPGSSGLRRAGLLFAMISASPFQPCSHKITGLLPINGLPAGP